MQENDDVVWGAIETMTDEINRLKEKIKKLEIEKND